MTNKTVEKTDNSAFVSHDVVYAQLYEEMRYYRNYELTVSTWYTTILLAILGGILAAKFGTVESSLSNYFNHNILVQWLVFGLATYIGFSSWYSVIYVSIWRYRELRTYIEKHLEPAWKQLSRKRIILSPVYFLLLTQLILVILVDIVIWL